MKKNTHTTGIQLAVIATVLFTICGCGEKTKNETSNDSLWNKPTETHEVLTLDKKVVNDTITIAGKRLTYEYCFEPSDSMPQVINADGQRYKDNIVRLVVRKDSTVLFKRIFCKKDFTEFVDAKNFKLSSLAGFNYNLTELDDHNALHFIATIGDPDETAGINYPIDIKIDPNGHFTMDKATDIETEPLLPGLNKEPVD